MNLLQDGLMNRPYPDRDACTHSIPLLPQALTGTQFPTRLESYLPRLIVEAYRAAGMVHDLYKWQVGVGGSVEGMECFYYPRGVHSMGVNTSHTPAFCTSHTSWSSIASCMRFTHTDPTPQAECLCQPDVLMGRNLVYCAPTSGGKCLLAVFVCHCVGGNKCSLGERVRRRVCV